MLTLGLPRGDAWQVPVLSTSAEKDEGIGDLLAAIDAHRVHLEDSGAMARRRRRIVETRILRIAEDIVRTRFAGRHDGRLAGLLDRVISREVDPYAAAMDLLAALDED